MQILKCFSAYFNGLFDSLKFHHCLFYFMTSKTIRYRTIQCFILNGVIFVGNILLAKHIIRPLISYILSSASEMPEVSSTTDNYDLDLDLDNSSSSSVWIENMNNMIEIGLYILYQILWLWPFYLLSFALNGMWYQDIADHAFILMNGKRKSRSFSFANWVNFMAEEVYRYLLVAVCLLQGIVVGFIPFIGKWLCIIHFAWLYALYSFEYKWSFLSWNLNKRLGYFERHWIYFFGFGTPLALITVLFPKFLGSGIYALCFPCFLIVSIVAKPIDHNSNTSDNDKIQHDNLHHHHNNKDDIKDNIDNNQSKSINKSRGLPIFSISKKIIGLILKKKPPKKKEE